MHKHTLKIKSVYLYIQRLFKFKGVNKKWKMNNSNEIEDRTNIRVRIVTVGISKHHECPKLVKFT